MTCQELDEGLDDFVDGVLAEAAASEVEAHLRSCALCQDRERRLRQVLAPRGGAAPVGDSARDLWPGIARRVEHERSWSWRSVGWSPVALAAAATVVIALLAALWSGRAPAGVRTVEIPAASPRAALVAARAGVSDPVLAAAERDYEAAANRPPRGAAAEAGPAPAGSARRREANLEVIDRALAEVRQALVRDPRNPELTRMLVSTYRKKVDVLSRVVKLSTALEMNRSKTMKRVALVLATILAGPAWLAAQTPVDQKHPATPDGTVSIENTAGSTKVTGWERPEVQVKGTVCSECELSVTGADKQVRVEVESNHVNPMAGKSDLEVFVPAGSSLEIEGFAATITVSGVNGSVRPRP